MSIDAKVADIISQWRMHVLNEHSSDGMSVYAVDTRCETCERLMSGSAGDAESQETIAAALARA